MYLDPSFQVDVLIILSTKENPVFVTKHQMSVGWAGSEGVKGKLGGEGLC